MAGTITAIAAALVLLSLILTLFLYKQKKASQRTMCCKKRVQEEGRFNRLEDQEMARNNETADASAPLNVNRPVNAIVGWLKSNYIRAKIIRKDKHLLIGTSEPENAELPEGWDTDEAQSVVTGEGQMEQGTYSDEQPMDNMIYSSTNNLSQDNLVAPGTPSHDHDHNQTHEQHRLVAEKSDYIDNSYPKLALAASSDSSPQNSFCYCFEQSQGVVFASTFARQPSIPEATAQEAQATTNDGSSRLVWAQQTNLGISPRECESDLEVSSDEKGKANSLVSTGVTISSTSTTERGNRYLNAENLNNNQIKFNEIVNASFMQF